MRGLGKSDEVIVRRWFGCLFLGSLVVGSGGVVNLEKEGVFLVICLFS